MKETKPIKMHMSTGLCSLLSQSARHDAQFNFEEAAIILWNSWDSIVVKWEFAVSNIVMRIMHKRTMHWNKYELRNYAVNNYKPRNMHLIIMHLETMT